MARVVILLVLMALIWPGCKAHGERAKYARFVNDFILLKSAQGEKIKAISTQEHYLTYRSEKNTELAKLLKTHSSEWKLTEAQLLKCKILMELNRLDEAGRILESVKANRPELESQIRLIRIQYLLYRGEEDKASPLLRAHREQSGDSADNMGEELLSIYAWMALHSENPAVRKEYAEKFLASRSIPYELLLCRSDMHRFLSKWELAHGELNKAREYLEKAIAEATDGKNRSALEAQRSGFELLGKPLAPVYADRWLNPAGLGVKPPAEASALSPLVFKDRAVLLCVWAKNSRPGQRFLPRLQELFTRFQLKGLTVIALTRLHGVEHVEAVENQPGPDSEIKGIQDFLNKHNITFPVAIDIQGVFSSSLKINSIPVLILANKRGEVVFFSVGADDIRVLEYKIKQILEVQ